MAKVFLLLASLSGAIAVVLGAFGAHGLKGKVADNLLAAYQTGVHYQMFHTLALIGLALFIAKISVPSAWLTTTGYCWLVGMVLFSGSLYGLALGGGSWLGPITPMGGLLLIVGWISFSIGIAKSSF